MNSTDYLNCHTGRSHPSNDGWESPGSVFLAKADSGVARASLPRMTRGRL